MRQKKYFIKNGGLSLLLLLLISSCSPKPFNLVLLPDTQNYTVEYPEIFEEQTKWIAENADDISFVLHQGDITDHNNDEQWQRALKALHLMDDKVPYTFVAGNHDIGSGDLSKTGDFANDRNSELFNKFLPYEKYSKAEGFGGAFETGKMDNTWHTFKAGGMDWLILSLEFGPRNKILEWANEVIKDHPDHKVIINTHAYMYSDNTRMDASRGDLWVPQDYGIGKDTHSNAVNDGEMMWEKLVSRHPNIMLIFSGHVLNSGAAKLVSTGVHGNKVYQMLANYQAAVEGAEKGGNGFLRIIKIDPKAGTISVKTYSPYIGQYKTEPHQEFTFEDVNF